MSEPPYSLAQEKVSEQPGETYHAQLRIAPGRSNGGRSVEGSFIRMDLPVAPLICA
jgi:hypothetical protein